MNEKALKTLEFNKVTEKIANFANSTLAKDMIDKLKPSINLKEIEILQSEVSQAVSMILKKGSLKVGGLRDISPYLQRTQIGGSLNFLELLNIADFLATCKTAKGYARSENKYDVYTILQPKFEIIITINDLENEITRCIISRTEMADTASQKLSSIRKQIKDANERVKTELRKIIQSGTYKNMLQESVITLRDDRYCVPVKAEHKNSFSGVIHDQSSTGSTVFMEPTNVITLNNKIKQLHSDEMKEINIVLKRLSETVNEHKDTLISNLEILKEIDFIFAKGEYSISIDGIEPKFNEDGYIDIKKARHPLIPKDEVVPTNIYMGKDFTTLLITGPNTGGKTVSLKTIGLFTIMGQSGIHIPAYEDSILSIFENIFCDIGDEQSIEQSLSTFSSHMTNIISILNEVTDKSLVILDEIGAGTDPTEGACLAISILKYLIDRKIITAVTTHYSELKVFAIQTEGVSNACCEFDVATLRPTYKLLIGVPGKSNAFAISKRLGLPEFLIDNAKSLLTKEDIKFEDVITDLEINKKSLMIEKENAKVYREEAERLKREIAEQKKKTNAQKEKILKKATEDAKRILIEAKIDATESIKEIQKLAKENANQNDINIQKQKLEDKINKKDLHLDKFKNDTKNELINIKDIKKGIRVVVTSLNQQGIVASNPNNKGEFMVKAGIMNIKLAIKDIKLDLNYKEIKPEVTKNRKVKFKNNKSQSISYEVDIRGFYVEDALDKVDKFIDDALLANMPSLSIIHGKGTGALRSAVHDYLRKNKRVSRYRIGEFGEGDAGVTIVELK